MKGYLIFMLLKIRGLRSTIFQWDQNSWLYPLPASTYSQLNTFLNMHKAFLPLWPQIISDDVKPFAVQWFGPADVPADFTEVDCCVDQRPPDVSVLAEVDGSPAWYFFLEDTMFIRCSFNTKSLFQLFILRCLHSLNPAFVFSCQISWLVTG